MEPVQRKVSVYIITEKIDYLKIIAVVSTKEKAEALVNLLNKLEQNYSFYHFYIDELAGLNSILSIAISISNAVTSFNEQFQN